MPVDFGRWHPISKFKRHIVVSAIHNFGFFTQPNSTVKVTLDQCNSNYLLNSTQLIAGHTRCRFLCKIRSLTQPNPIHPLLLLAPKVLLDFQSQPNPIHLKPLVLHPSLTAILYYKCSATSS